ncbi:integrin beta-like protein A isoform X2 [Xiphophorus couchianus]|uniref:integrin beta-like protein A isoform X2 n=1 Tax=Xiphophorus couchianus TaxID=32473 RepID=UPI0010167B73|nr:integrin beta-like protein A isoform X2 [Xiphophorus couchianus]
MLLSVLLVMMVISWTEAVYTGTVITHTTKNVQGNSFTLVRRYKFGHSSCGETESFISCSGCTQKIDESSGEWCLREYPTWGSRSFIGYYYGLNPGTWINNKNGISTGLAKVFVEGRKRSDINRPNSSPKTGILPVMRVPSNCQRNIRLLTFDPDGDHVQCRNGSGSNECYTCTPPSVLSLSSSCSLSFSPTSSKVEGSYAVQLMMEDFPSQTIALTDNTGSTASISSKISMSRIPVQFVFKVDPAAPSCTAGEYLPRFLPPTPEHGAQFFINVTETIEINITAEATQSVITELLFSGPFNMTKSSSGSGYFTLTWTPSDSQNDDNESHPICFAVQANASSSIYQSELRCVIVRVGNIPFIAIPSPPTTSVTSTTVALPLTTTSPPVFIPC